MLSAAAATAQTHQSEALGAAMRALEGEVAGLGQQLAQEAPALRETVAALGARVGENLDDVVARVEACGQAQAERLGAFESGPLEAARDALAKALQPASRESAAAQARGESLVRQIAVSAAALSALTERESRDFEGLRAAFHGAEAAVAGAATALSGQLSSVMQAQASQWGETFAAWGEGALASLDQTTQSLAQTGAALAKVGEGVEIAAAQAQDAQARLAQSLVPLAPAVTALRLVTETLEASAGPWVSGSAERREARAQSESFAAIQASLAGLAARDADAVETLRVAIGEIAALSAQLGGTLTQAVTTAVGALAQDFENLRTGRASDARSQDKDADADRAALGAFVAEAMQQFDARLQAFGAESGERLGALERRLAGDVVAFDRSSIASSLTVFRSLSRDFSEAMSRLDAVTALVESRTPGDSFGAGSEALAV